MKLGMLLLQDKEILKNVVTRGGHCTCFHSTMLTNSYLGDFCQVLRILFLLKLWNKKWGSPCSFKRKGAFILLSSLVWGKSLTFYMCTRSCACANDAKIMHSRDAQCNTKESPVDACATHNRLCEKTPPFPCAARNCLKKSTWEQFSFLPSQSQTDRVFKPFWWRICLSFNCRENMTISAFSSEFWIQITDLKQLPGL